MKLLIARARRRSHALLRRFGLNERGATAVEFAFVAIPFFMILFGIIELALVFFVTSALVHSTSEAGRVLRVGNFQACGGADEFKALVCKEMDGMGNCWKNLRVDVVTNPSFKTVILPPPPDPTPEVDDGDPTTDDTPQTPNGVFMANVAGDPIVVRATLYYKLAIPAFATRLDDPKGSGIRRISAITAFRNEPFPATGSCDSDTQTNIDSGTP